ncbi:MAG: hypothetical protein P3W93_002115 [Thermus sp.]|nr:hypothetical protein [Thermus sp.]
MEPGFHHLYAGRLAWRHRLLLAIPLALLSFLHPLFALASGLPFLLPTRLWERRALREIARISLAYPTALAYGEAPLWQEAKRVRAQLPPFPVGLFVLYVVLLVLALTWGSWTPKAPSTPWPLAGHERPLEEQQEEPGPRNGEGRPRGKAPPSPQEGEEEPFPGPMTPGESTPSQTQAPNGEGREEGSKGLEAQGERPAAAPQGEGQGEGEPRSRPEEGEKASASGPSGLPPKVETPTLSVPEAIGPEEGLLAPGGEGNGQALPSPWQQGRPPEAVRRGVEVYLERTPLPPEARELLRRYFSGP